MKENISAMSGPIIRQNKEKQPKNVSAIIQQEHH